MANEFNNTGLFLPNNFIWDVTDFNEIDLNSSEFKELLVRLYQNINAINLAVNLKDSAYYSPQEFVNGQVFIAQDNQISQQVYRVMVNVGALPNNSSLSAPHGIEGIDGNYAFTRIYGAASNPNTLSYIPLPYASSNGTDNVELSIDSTSVVITTTANYSAYTISYVVLEYIKNSL